MPKSELQYQEIREQSKKNILDAAFASFIRYGYTGASIAIIAKKAGISKGLIYNYFESKESILEALFVRFSDLESEMMDGVDFSNPKVALYSITNQAFDMAEKTPQVLRMFMQFGLEMYDLPMMQNYIQNKIKSVLHLTVNSFKELGYANPENEAWFFSSSLEGILLYAVTAKDQYPLKEMKSHFLKTYKLSKHEKNN